MQASKVQGLGPGRGRGGEPPPRWGPGVPSVLGSAWQPRGPADLCHPLALWSQPETRPEGGRLRSVLPNDPGPAKTYCHSPTRNPAGVRLGRARPGPFFPTPKLCAPHCLPAPIPGLRDPPKNQDPPARDGAAQPRIHTQAHRTQKSSFLQGERGGSHYQQRRSN